MAQTLSIEGLEKLIRAASPKSANLALKQDTHLFDSGILDSYSAVQLVLAFEKEFDIVFDYSDLNAKNFRTIDAMIRMLREKYDCK